MDGSLPDWPQGDANCGFAAQPGLSAGNRSVTAMEATHLSRFYMPQQMRAVSWSALRRVQLTSYDRDGGRSKLRIRSESCPDLPGTGHSVTFAWYSRARHQVGEGVGEVETHCG